jgi:hypothetical protein
MSRVSYCADPAHIVPVHADQPTAYLSDGATWCQSVPELPSTHRSHISVAHRSPRQLPYVNHRDSAQSRYSSHSAINHRWGGWCWPKCSPPRSATHTGSAAPRSLACGPGWPRTPGVRHQGAPRPHHRAASAPHRPNTATQTPASAQSDTCESTMQPCEESGLTITMDWPQIHLTWCPGG